MNKFNVKDGDEAIQKAKEQLMSPQNHFWCEGCGEPRYKCYCNEDCPHCGKKLIKCIAESETGWCKSDTSPFTQKLIKEALSGNNNS